MSSGEATLLLKIKQVGQEVLDRVVITFGDIVDMAKAVGEALWSTIEAFREEESAINKLSQAMIQSGTFTGDLRQEYIQMASALQDLTTFGDEQIISAQAILQTHIGNRKVTEDLVKATLDLAAAKKMDLSSAAELVGKAISSENDILARHGIHVEYAANANQKLANVISAVEGKVGGQAAAMARGLGSVDQLKNTWSDFLEKIGALAAPTVSNLSRIANGFLKVFSSMMPEQFNASKSTISGITAEVQRLRIEIVKISESPILPKDDKERMIADLEQKIAAHKAAQEQMLADQKAASDRSNEIDAETNRNWQEKQFEKQILAQNNQIVEQEMQAMTDEQKLAAQVQMIDAQLAQEQSFAERKQLIADRAALIEQQKEEIKKKNKLKIETMFQQQRSELIGAASDLITAIGDKESKAVFFIQKAAAIAQTIIATQVAAAQAMATVPYPASLAAVANIELLGKIKLATIAATAIKGLATGGVVPATPGGTPFILGEGGKDEAVIPLEDGKIPGGGGGVTININGNVVGDEQSLYALAKMLDPQFLKLRQNNESVAFDTGVL